MDSFILISIIIAITYCSTLSICSKQSIVLSNPWGPKDSLMVLKRIVLKDKNHMCK